MVGNEELRHEIEAFLRTLQEGIPNCMLTGIWFGEPRSDGDLYVSTYWDWAVGTESIHDSIQEVPTNQFHWFMSQIRATMGKSGRDLMVISDYDTIPLGDPLRDFYPPSFRAVADYVVWEEEFFPGWIGMLSMKEPIDWESATTHQFIADTIDEHRTLLLRAYHDDFLRRCRDSQP